MARQSLHIALSGIILLATTQAALPAETRGIEFANDFPGRWSLQSAYSAPCSDCAVGIIRSGGVLLVMTNMGWAGVLETQSNDFASGQAVMTDGRSTHFKIEMAVRANVLLIATTANEDSTRAPNLIATFARQNIDTAAATKL